MDTTTYSVLPEYTDGYLIQRAADTGEDRYRSACLALLTVHANWRQSIVAAADVAATKIVKSGSGLLIAADTGIDVHDETVRLVMRFHAGWRPERREGQAPGLPSVI